MITHKHIDYICILVCLCAIVLTIVFMNGSFAFTGTTTAKSAPYTYMLFDDSKVHTLDIVMNESDWEEMIGNALEEEYVPCSLVIDGEKVKNVAIRTKGTTSLTMVSSMNSERFSFKIEFDHYVKNKTYYGLDKLCLNNTIQDTTYMKDYLCYHMMNEMGIAAPLTSFVSVTVNGEPFGLYVAVEGVEEAFIERNYGEISGRLYKPETMQEGNRGAVMGSGQDSGASLRYVGDNLDNYQTIWDGAIFDVSEKDQKRLVESLKNLDAGEDLDEAVDIDSVLRYFVVHNFTVNFDSYAGSMQHNYYLYEENGKLSMIPWDYNLAFGTFAGGMGTRTGIGGRGSGATDMVNFPIDTPVSGTTLEERPMLGKLLEVPEYLDLYHDLFDKFIAEYFESGEFEEDFDRVVALISDYVKNDPTAFYSFEEFQKGIATLKEFCLLRAESIRGQLDGIIPSTSQSQSASPDLLINADYLSLSDMGTMNAGGDFAPGDQAERPQMPQDGQNAPPDAPFVPSSGEDTQNVVPQQPGFSGAKEKPSFTDVPNLPLGQGTNQPNIVYLLIASVIVLALGIVFAR